MGVTLQSQGKLKESVESNKQAISLKPDYVASYINMGITFKEQGKLEEAIEAYQKALLLNPNYIEAYINMSHARSFH